jgi:hypothetical protein
MNVLAVVLGLGAACGAGLLAWRGWSRRSPQALAAPPAAEPEPVAEPAAPEPTPEQVNVGQVTHVAPSVAGFLESVSTTRVWGWAYQETTPDLHVQVEIWAGKQLLGSGQADMYRPDLERAGVGRGDHAFAIDITTPDMAVAEPPIVALAFAPGGEKVKLRGA